MVTSSNSFFVHHVLQKRKYVFAFKAGFNPAASLVLGAALVLGIALAFSADRARAQESQVVGIDQVISGEDLRAMGVTQLGEIVRYIHAGRNVTIDGFSSRISLNGLGSFHEPGPALYIDGHPIDISLFDTESLNLLGLPLEAIDRVEISAKPALIFGSLAGRGAIHLRTRRAVEGARVDAAISAENEVGDPGPFAYIDEAANVDTQGPGVRALMEGGLESGGARLSGVYHRHYLTKPALVGRLLGLQDVSDAPVIEVASPALSAEWRRPTYGASVVVLGTSSRLYPFLPYASREIAADYRATNVSAMVRHEIGQNSFLRHRLSFATQHAENPEDSMVPFRWNQQSVTANSAWGRSIRRMVVVLGGTGRLDRARGSEDASRYSAGLYAAVAGTLTGTAQYQGGGMIATDGNSAAVRSYGGITLRPAPGHRGDLYFSIVDDLAFEQDPADSWERRRIDVPLFPERVDRQTEDVSIRATGDAEWSWSPDAEQTLRGGLGLRIASGTYVFDRQIDRIEPGYQTTDISYDYASGTNGVAWFEYRTRVLPGSQRIFWHHEATLHGGERFRDVWKAVPDSRFGFSLYLPVAPDFVLHTSVVRQDDGFWKEFGRLAGVDADVPGSTLLDAAVYKRLLAGHLHVRLAFRNVLREDVRYHPLGDTFDLSARIDIRVDFEKTR